MKLQVTLLAALAITAVSGSAFAATAEETIAAQKCGKCHTATTTKKAPSFASVATKYKGAADAEAKLVKELKAGGKVGAEEDHTKLEASDADITAVVKFVLASK